MGEGSPGNLEFPESVLSGQLGAAKFSAVKQGLTAAEMKRILGETDGR
jgi:hypothetical protein